MVDHELKEGRLTKENHQKFISGALVSFDFNRNLNDLEKLQNNYVRRNLKHKFLRLLSDVKDDISSMSDDTANNLRNEYFDPAGPQYPYNGQVVSEDETCPGLESSDEDENSESSFCVQLYDSFFTYDWLSSNQAGLARANQRETREAKRVRIARP